MRLDPRSLLRERRSHRAEAGERRLVGLASFGDDERTERARQQNLASPQWHTALGDALMTAEVYVRLLALMEDAGVATFGEALALAARPRRIIARQRESGW